MCLEFITGVDECHVREGLCLELILGMYSAGGTGVIGGFRTRGMFRIVFTGCVCGGSTCWVCCVNVDVWSGGGVIVSVTAMH